MMLGELALKFALGGFIVTSFAVIGELWRPKTFSGIFGAAPSVALSTLILAAAQRGPREVVVQTRAMIFGGIAFVAYCIVLAMAVRRLHLPAWLEAAAAWSVWLAIALTLWATLGRR
ncbi:MAG TPA: DUF3147 family protein [Polyangia bacterium]|jgi:uncharacterized membrane protein (GlpM family)|nr:DUF3147 family protein [Polyangia bacterium]